MRISASNLIVGSSLLVLASSVSAETAPGAGLEEIIVTARRVEERLQDVPISITVFSQEQISNRNITNASDLASFTPSLAANSNFGSENTTFAIRGFVQDIGTPPSVGTYFGDVVAPRGPTQGTAAGDSLGPGSFFDLQNVQVLKGPQGTLFGRNTTGGAVLLVPQKPTSSFEGYAEGSYGNYNMYRLQGALNMPFSDAVRFRIAADHQQRDGYLHNISGIGPQYYNDVDYTAVRASLVVDLATNIENYTVASYSKSDTNGSVQKLIGCNPAGFDPPNPALGLRNFIGVFSCGQLAAEAARGTGFYDLQMVIPNPESLIEQKQIINTTTWHAADEFTIKNIASYAEFRNRQRTQLFGTNWQLNALPAPYSQLFFRGIPAIFTGINPIPGGSSADQSTYTEELQLQGAVARFTYQAGAYFEWSDPLSVIGNQSLTIANCTDLAAITCTDPVGSALSAAASQQAGAPVAINVGGVGLTKGRTTYRSRGLYTQSSYELTDRFKLTGGLRYTWDEQTNEATRISYSFPVLPPFTGGATSRCTDPGSAPSCQSIIQQTSEKPTWLVGLDYKLTDDALLYGKYARGYRAGGVFSNAPTDHRTFQPEKVDNFEVGLKSSFDAAVKGTFNVAAFYNDFSNQQLQIGFNPRQGAAVANTTAILNAGKSRIYGAEVGASITPVVGLTFDVDYTYLDTEIREIDAVTTTDPNYQPSNSLIPIGSPLALSPKHKYTLSGNYTLPLGPRIGRISVGLTWSHTDEQLSSYNDQQPAVLAALGKDYGILSSRDLLSANANWNAIVGLPIDISLFATNLTNREYYQFVPGLGSSGLESAVLGEPRMYGARLRYRFGD